MQGDDKSLLQTMVCEKTTAMYTASAACAALFAKGRGSGGQAVKVKMDTVCMHYLMPDVFWGLSWRFWNSRIVDTCTCNPSIHVGQIRMAWNSRIGVRNVGSRILRQRRL